MAARAALSGVSQERELSSSQTAYSKAVMPELDQTAHVNGQVVRIGAIDVSKRAKNGQRDFRVEQKLNMIQDNEQYLRMPAVTIINFCPFPLAINSAMPELRNPIPAAENADKYQYRTLEGSAIQSCVIEGALDVVQFPALKIAREYQREYGQIGGVLVIEGHIRDFDPENNPQQKKDVAEATARLRAHCRRMFSLGNELWNTPQHSGSRDITDMHRTAATWLNQMGELGHLPEWMDPGYVERVETVPPCPDCGATPAPTAVRCTANGCGRVLDPIRAYQQGTISEEDRSLERLTRAEVEALDVSAYVAETADEKPARIKAGKPKPLSQVAQRQLAAK